METPVQQTGSWGDQGDGMYRNPILNADYPDVDIERAGDRYYLITSTIHYAPGMLLAESRDLVNWCLLGHVFQRLDWQPKYNWDQMDGYSYGVWAGDLAHHDGRWFCYFIDSSAGLYMSSADRIQGPWAPARCMLAKTRWTDPAVFWDEDQMQAYLVCNYGHDYAEDNRGLTPEGNEIRVFRMSWDGESLQDEGTPVYYGTGAEAAKIYRINGSYYIFLAQWIDGDRKQIALRGPALYGPFERRVLLERAVGAVRSTCQGALVQAPDGSWWLTHQLVQHRRMTREGNVGPSSKESYEGRSQWLIPVRWEDGWPICGEDPEGNGIGNTIWVHRKPVDGFPVDAPQTGDDFDSAEPGPQWAWNHNPRPDRWSLAARPGWLRLYASKPVGEGGFWNAPNTISQRLMGTGEGVATVRLDLGGLTPGTQAGLCRHSGQYVLLGVAVGEDGSRRLFFQNNERRQDGPEVRADELYVRTRNDGRHARFEYSSDGDTWSELGPGFTLTFGRWRGDRIGLFCWNVLTDEKAGYLDADWFRYQYDGPKGA